MKKTTEERLAERFIRTPGGCWYWTGRVDRDGYGRIQYERQDRPAYRVMMIIRGHNADGLDVDHLCRNRRCVNPLHLDVVTRAENNRRKWLAHGSKLIHGRALKTHCIRGHEFTEANTYAHKRGRTCRACNRAAFRKRKGASL